MYEGGIMGNNTCFENVCAFHIFRSFITIQRIPTEYRSLAAMTVNNTFD